MKKYFLLSMLSFIILLINSCKKDVPVPVASFSMDKTTCKVGQTITFTNLSENATMYVWDFGDGNSSTDKNPTHSYSSAGTFTIKLTATGKGGTNITTNTISILPTLTGTWYKIFTFSSGDSFYGTMKLVQQNNNILTGTFTISDNSFYAILLSSSLITDNNVTIEWILTGSSYILSFKGTVNSSYNSMGGLFYSSGTQMGTWVATKTSKKSTEINDKKSINSEKERLLKLLND